VSGIGTSGAFLALIRWVNSKKDSSAEIKASGKLLIPTAAGEKPYTCVIVFTQDEIKLECDKRIFQAFNLFDTPKQAKIKVNTAEVEEIRIQQNKMFIITKESFWRQYRNISTQVYTWKYFGYWHFEQLQKWALIFIVDNPAAFDNIVLIGGLVIDDRRQKSNG
jgi:hypothetical protein